MKNKIDKAVNYNLSKVEKAELNVEKMRHKNEISMSYTISEVRKIVLIKKKSAEDC